MSDKARYYMIGGFLGAGKTTAVAALAQHLTKAGLRVGLITNDQGSELVDTAMLRARGFATESLARATERAVLLQIQIMQCAAFCARH